MTHVEWGLFAIFIVLLMIFDQLRRLNGDNHDSDYSSEPPSAPMTAAQKERSRKISLQVDIVRRFNEEEREREIRQGVEALRRSKQGEKLNRPSSDDAEKVMRWARGEDSTTRSADPTTTGVPPTLAQEDVEVNNLCNTTILPFDYLLDGTMKPSPDSTWRVLSKEEADELRRRQPPPPPKP